MRKAEHYEQNKASVWENRVYDLENPVDMVRYIARHQFAWPGGYELCGVADDGGLLCSQCIRENYKLILWETKHRWNTGWSVVAISYEGEMEDDYCDHCNKPLGYQTERDID